MPSRTAITDVRLIGAVKEDAEKGLLAWITFTLGAVLRVDGVTLRRTRDGRRTLSFPSRLDGAGRRHPIIHPVDEDTRREIENQVFAAIGLGKLVSR